MKVWVSPSLWLIIPLFLIMLGLAIPGIFTPTVLWLQVFLAVVCCALVGMGWRLVRGMVLVIDEARIWADGKWHPDGDVIHVTLGSLPWEIVDLPQLVLVTSGGTDISPGLWRFRESSAVRAGNRLAEQLGVPFV